MSSIPEELYRDILLRLPVRSILVCKCVCKDWYALITSSDFVDAHATIQKNNPNLLLQADGLLYQTGYDSLASLVFEFQRDVIKMDYPFKSDYVKFWGSCNGLLFMWLNESDDRTDWPIPLNNACFWNPATREYKVVTAQPPRQFQPKHVCMRAFAHDHKNNDYKLVVGVRARQESRYGSDKKKSKYGTLFQVYSLSSDSWTIGPRVPYRFFESDNRVLEKEIGVLVNGDFHVLAEAQDNCVLLSLDISDVSFKEVQVPKEFSEKGKRMSSVGVLEGSLSVLVSKPKVFLEIWVMLDYGVLESLNKRYVIATGNGRIIYGQADSSIVWCLKNGQILLKAGLGLVLYDPEGGSARKPDLDNILINRATNYFVSLVSLNSGTCVLCGGKRRTPESIET